VRIGFLGDGAWAQRALGQLMKDPRYTVAFVAVRASRPDQELVDLAKSNDVPLLCPAAINAAESVAEIARFEADLHVSMSYDQILRERILGLPPRGTLNCHAGALGDHQR
jgi:methionyl-tRNA formyltransferase